MDTRWVKRGLCVSVEYFGGDPLLSSPVLVDHSTKEVVMVRCGRVSVHNIHSGMGIAYHGGKLCPCHRVGCSVLAGLYCISVLSVQDLFQQAGVGILDLIDDGIDGRGVGLL